MAERAINITTFIDERRLSWFNWQVVLLGFLLMLVEGFDGGVISYALPAMIKDWGVTDMAALGAAVSIGIGATFVGAMAFGWIGDRYGRKLAILSACFGVAISTMATIWATNLGELATLRFFVGLGIGGLMPNIGALNAEFAPKRHRATLVSTMSTGLALGAALPAFVARWMIPLYGWQVLFLVGVCITLAACVIAWIWLPESIKYLVLRGDRRQTVERTLRHLEPSIGDLASTEFTLSQEKKLGKFSPAQLFNDRLGLITPLIWLLAICNTATFYFVTTWLPTVMHIAGVGGSYFTLTYFYVGGTLGGIVIGRPLDRIGLLPFCLLFLLAIPLTCSMGYVAQYSELLLMAVVFFSGFCLLGLQFGINTVSALIYPTAIRSNGSGWTIAIGKVGAVAGPIIGGYLIGIHLPIRELYFLLAVPLSVAALAAFIVARLNFARYQSHDLNARELATSRAAAIGEPSIAVQSDAKPAAH